jgi:anti-sigma factor RsiW
LQALLEGELREAERARIEGHVHACARCSGELDGWRALYSDLAALPALEPPAGFAPRVLGQVSALRPVPLAARVRRRLAALVPSRGQGHVATGRLQDYLDGALPAGATARIRAHLAACPECAREDQGWRALAAGLAALEAHAPAPGFADRVMAGVRVAAPAASPVLVPAWGGVLATARSLVPRTRRAWATISGVAVTPAVTAGVALYAVFSHPTLTPGALLAFAWWKTTALGGALWQTITTATLESAQLFDLYSLAETASAAPVALAGGVLAYSLACALALRVLYKNLVAPRMAEPPHASLSLS